MKKYSLTLNSWVWALSMQYQLAFMLIDLD